MSNKEGKRVVFIEDLGRCMLGTYVEGEYVGFGVFMVWLCLLICLFYEFHVSQFHEHGSSDLFATQQLGCLIWILVFTCIIDINSREYN